MSKQTSKSLTFRYCLHQILFWAATGGVISFAATYLLDKGFDTAQIGWILFAAYILSFLIQPLMGSAADKISRNILPGLVFFLSCLSSAAFLTLRFLAPPIGIFAALYIFGVLCLDIQTPLLNSISVYYTRRGWTINYGLGRGLGGFGFALATLGYGYLMEYFGADQMPIASVALILISALVTLSYPKDDSAAVSDERTKQNVTSLARFFAKYKWYCLSLLGVLFLAMFHVMTENYLIEIFRNLGGDSSNVGMALFIATVTELPGMTLYPKVRKKYGTKPLLIISGASFVLKGILLIFAGSVTAVYCIQLLQCLTYVLLSMSQMYYAEESTAATDMIKGQSMITAFYTLGCAAGNLFGGVLINSFGLRIMLIVSFLIALVGTLVFALTLPKVFKINGKLSA